MQPFTKLDAVAAPYAMADVDTDQIIPARFLKYPRGPEYATYLFHDLRFDAEGKERPDFVLHQPELREASIIIADRNFGCGSSREGAVYALQEKGIRCVIAESFGDIFYSNSLKNGLLPVRLPREALLVLRGLVADQPGARVKVDLAAQTVTGPNGWTHHFDIAPFPKQCLLKGLDDTGFTMEQLPAIEAFEQGRADQAPWLPRTVSATGGQGA